MERKDIFDLFTDHGINPNRIESYNSSRTNQKGQTYKRVELIIELNNSMAKNFFAYSTIDELFNNISKLEGCLSVKINGSTTIKNFSYSHIVKIETTLVTQ